MMADTSRRLEPLDQFRGLAIVTMVLANYLAGVHWVPAWLKHAPDVGLTVIDLIAPMFIFAIGVTYGGSARRRLARASWRPTLAHFFRRFMTLVGLGAIVSVGEVLVYSPQAGNWGVLQSIGVAGLLTLAVIFLPAWARLAAGAALLGVYQVLLNLFWLEKVLHSPHGGLLGALSWSAMLVLATALADLWPRPRNFTLGASLTLAAGLLLALWVPVSKNRVSASYVLISLGFCALLLALLNLLNGRLGWRVPWLSAWGKNPLLLYLLHYILLALVVLPDVAGWYADAPGWLVAAQAAGLLAVLGAVAAWLDRRGWVLAL